MFDYPVATAEKANGTSVQGRNSSNGFYDFPIGPVNPFSLLTANLAGLQPDGIPPWSYYPTYRDAYLRLLAKREPIMAGALYSSTVRFKSLRWEVNAGRNTKKWAQSLLGEADGGAGFEQLAGKVSYDLDTQDNGAFIELVGPGKPDSPLTGRVQAIYHLDSAQCWRTFDTEYPVIYINPMDNSYHRMHKSRVIMMSSNPQPDERARNIGFCAVSRALKMMQIIRHVETYKEEKISGRFKRGLIYGGPLTPKQFNQVMDKNELDADNALLTVLNDIPVVLSTIGDMKLNMLDLASLPDGFDYVQEINTYVNILALCFGTDAREFWPASQHGATKADASVQHQKAQGKGIADKIKTFETAFNWQVFPEGCSLEFDNTDDDQDKAQADIATVKITNISLMQQNGWIDAQQSYQLAVSQGLIDPGVFDNTTDFEVADDSAPMDNTQPDQQTTDTTQPTGEFDTTTVGAQSKYNPDSQPQFVESKHPRSTNGKFGSGGTTPPPKAAAPAPSAATNASADPMTNALLSFLGKTPGKFKNGRLTVPGETKDRSAELQAKLRSSGFPNAKVHARVTRRGITYSISGIKAKKAPKVKGAQKANPENHVNKYQKQLEGIMTATIKKVAAKPSTFKSAVDDLHSQFISAMPQALTDSFGVGLAGEDPTDDGIEQLGKIGQTSADYFKNSFIPALAAVSLVGLGAKDIEAALSPFVDRLGMYAGSAWESIWRGAGDAMPASTRVKRVLEDGAAHCATCPDKAGEYDSFDEMEAEVGVPGDGSDDCLSNCRCYLLTEDEDGGFSPLVGSPTVFTMPLFEVIK